jgi:hypothetical protein
MRRLVSWFRKAAEASEARGMHNLGLQYSNLHMFSLDVWRSFGIGLLCAEMFFILTRYSDILLLATNAGQRNKVEEARISRGLGRSIVLEMLVFVPISAILFFVAIRPFVLSLEPLRIRSVNGDFAMALNGSMGIISYGFPFVTVRRVVTLIALNTLKQFYELSLKAQDTKEVNQVI